MFIPISTPVFNAASKLCKFLFSRFEDIGMKAELLSPEEDPLALCELPAVDEQEELETHHTSMKSKGTLSGRYVSDEEVFAQFKEDSRKQYKRMWAQFRDFSVFNFESGPPGEEYFTKFFQYLRLEKNYASSSMWTFYSCLKQHDEAKIQCEAASPHHAYQGL